MQSVDEKGVMLHAERKPLLIIDQKHRKLDAWI